MRDGGEEVIEQLVHGHLARIDSEAEAFGLFDLIDTVVDVVDGLLALVGLGRPCSLWIQREVAQLTCVFGNTVSIASEMLSARPLYRRYSQDRALPFPK